MSDIVLPCGCDPENEGCEVCAGNVSVIARDLLDVRGRPLMQVAREMVGRAVRRRGETAAEDARKLLEAAALVFEVCGRFETAKDVRAFAARLTQKAATT